MKRQAVAGTRSVALTLALASTATLLLLLGSGASATEGLATLAAGQKLTLESQLSIQPGALSGIASASGTAGARVLVISASYPGSTPQTAPMGGYQGTTLVAAYDAQSLVLLWENTSLALPSVSAPIAVDRDGDGIDEIALWGSGRLLWFDLAGNLLADYELENETNPVARTPTPVPILDGSWPPDLLLAGRHGQLLRVGLNGTVRWALPLASRALVGEVLIAGRDSSGNWLADLSDGSSNPTFGPEGGWTALSGNAVFLVDISNGVLSNTVNIPGGFPPVRGALSRPDAGASGLPDLMAANGSGTVFRVTLTSTARGTAIYAEIPAGAETGFNALVVCPEGAWGHASLFEHVGSAVYGFDSVGAVWNRSAEFGGLIVGVNLPLRDSCTVAAAQSHNLSLYDSAYGTDSGTLELPAEFTARMAQVVDLDGDGWMEIIVVGQNASRIAPSIVALALAPLAITPTSPSGGAVLDVWAGGYNWTSAVGELGGLPAPLPFDRVSVSVGPAASSWAPSYLLGTSTFQNTTQSGGLWVDGGNSSVVWSGGLLSFTINLSAAWNYGGPGVGALTLILSGPNRPPAFINTTIGLQIHWIIETVQAPSLWADGIAINSSAWVSPASTLSFEWGPLRYANTSRLVWPAAFNWSANLTPITPVNLTADADGGVRVEWQFSPLGPGTEEVEIVIEARVEGGPTFTYGGTLMVDRILPEVAAVSPEANNTKWFSDTRVVLGARVCDNESGIAATGVEVLVDGSPTSTTIVSEQTDGGCLALLVAIETSEGQHVAELRIRDRAGNHGALPPPIPLRVDLQGLQFSNFWPTSWTSEVDVSIGCQVDDQGGSGIDLGQLQWAFAGSPAGPFVFAQAGANGSAATYLLGEVVTGAAEGYLFAQFSGRDMAGNNRSFSPIIVVRIDRTAPEGAIIEDLDGDVRSTPALALNLSVADTLSGLDLDGSWIRWENETANETFPLSAGLVGWVDSPFSAIVFLSLTTPPGWSNISVMVLDRAGNALNLGPRHAYLNLAPRLVVNGLAAGSVVMAGEEVAVAFAVEDDDGSPWTLSFSIDGQEWPNQTRISLNVAPGGHLLVVNVTDAYGLRDSVSIEFYAEARAPPVGTWVQVGMALAVFGLALAVAFVVLRANRRRLA